MRSLVTPRVITMSTSRRRTAARVLDQSGITTGFRRRPKVRASASSMSGWMPEISPSALINS